MCMVICKSLIYSYGNICLPNVLSHIGIQLYNYPISKYFFVPFPYFLKQWSISTSCSLFCFPWVVCNYKLIFMLKPAIYICCYIFIATYLCKGLSKHLWIITVWHTYRCPHRNNFKKPSAHRPTTIACLV